MHRLCAHGNEVNSSEALIYWSHSLVSRTVINHCVAERTVRKARTVNSRYLCSMDRAYARSITPCIANRAIKTITSLITRCHAIAGSTARCGCKFRCNRYYRCRHDIKNKMPWYRACGFSGTARVSCISLHQRPFKC